MKDDSSVLSLNRILSIIQGKLTAFYDNILEGEQ